MKVDPKLKRPTQSAIDAAWENLQAEYSRDNEENFRQLGYKTGPEIEKLLVRTKSSVREMIQRGGWETVLVRTSNGRLSKMHRPKLG